MVALEKYKRLLRVIFAAVLMAGLLVIYGAVWIGYYNEYVLWMPFYRKGNWVIIAMYGVLLSFLLHTYGGFKIGHLRSGNLIYSQILSLVFTNLFTYFFIAVLDRRFVSPVYIFLMTAAEALFVVLWTLLFRPLYRNLFPPRRMLFVEGSKRDFHLQEKMNSRDDKYEICEVVSYKQGMEFLKGRIAAYDSVIVGDMPSHERNLILKYCFSAGKRTYAVPKISDILMRNADELDLFDTSLFLSRNQGLTAEQSWMKRAEDLVMASLMLVVFSPIFLIAAVGIKCTDRGPVFYKQERLTKDGKRFYIYKFRTMIVDAEKLSGAVLASEHDPRITPVGRVLRATRMDELPQIINILKGDMSVVGPRPERPELAAEIEKEVPEFSYRLKVKAGLTGYAQIYGKYNTTFYDKLKLDLMYICKYSVLLDLKLIMMTPKIMFMKESTEGVASEQEQKHE